MTLHDSSSTFTILACEMKFASAIYDLEADCWVLVSEEMLPELWSARFGSEVHIFPVVEADGQMRVAGGHQFGAPCSCKPRYMKRVKGIQRVVHHVVVN